MLKYKIIVMDRNGRSSKFVVKEKPVITDQTITLKPTPFYELVFVINNLTSYSITTLKTHPENVQSTDKETEDAKE